MSPSEELPNRMNPNPYIIASVLLVALVVCFVCGCSVNGRPMRFDPRAQNSAKARSWFIEGKTHNGAPVSCSFVEFDERGDYIDFSQHVDCEQRIAEYVRSGKLLLVMYCHGWKNSSQSGDVNQFNTFLSRLADSDEIRAQGLRVHGVYLGWRGNLFRPYVNENPGTPVNKQINDVFGESIVDSKYHRRWHFTWMVPENLTYWSRKKAAEQRVSALPVARAIFTYASAAKAYGNRLDNRVVVIGHSFGALLLERGLGQGMTGAIAMEWWDKEHKDKTLQKPGLPFDLVLFVNSAAPAIYAKEMRDFLMADRKSKMRDHKVDGDVPVIVSITSTGDKATGMLHPLGNAFAPFSPSLKRKYTSGILGLPVKGVYPQHHPIRQSVFYTKTPGHHPYLLNHWVVAEKSAPGQPPEDAFKANLSLSVQDQDLFWTSHPRGAWRLSQHSPSGDQVFYGLPPAMRDANYWIVSCGSELIKDHNDVWSDTAMEMYAGVFRACELRRRQAEQ